MEAVNIFSFHGGIHPPENKAQSLQLPLGRPRLPKELILPLGQHIGQASRPLVKAGDKVLKGESIAVNNGFLSSYLHAPTSGIVTSIESRPIAHPSGLSDICIIIEPDNKEEWIPLSPLNNWQEEAPTDVLAYLSKMGIVGMGGAGFPTQVKLQGAQKNILKHFIINAAECEPYITADDMLIREKTLELILGIEALQHLVQAEQVIIGIEDNKPTAIAKLNELLSERGSEIQVAVVPTKYPSGGEKQLIQLITGQEVPSGQFPADIGVLCQNVGTCVAVHNAIYLGQPLISRFTTLTGDALKAPQNVEVLLGTPVDHLLDYAEANNKKLHRLVMGGPMMGFTLDSTAVPVVKTSNCILAATKKELPEPDPEQACIRCGMCEQACPASLLPQQLLWFSKSQELEKAEHHNLFDCIECGACSYVCPSSIPLVQYYRHTKSSIREAREAAVKSDLAKQRFEARKARQEAEIAEKEAKRLARKAPAPAKAADTTKAASKAASASAAPAANAEAKKLKVDVAIAKTKLKKLQKQLLEAQENEHIEDIQALQLQVTEQEQQVKQLDEQLAKVTAAQAPAASASTAQSNPAVSAELKKAKVDLALAGVKLKKLQKQLVESPDDTELKDKISSLEKELSAAQALVDKLSAAPASNAQEPAAKAPVSAELKKAKVDVAMIDVKLKKLQKQSTESPDDQALKDQISGLEKDLSAAQALVEKLSAPAPEAKAPAAKTPVSAELKKAKVDVAMIGVKLKKLQKQLAESPDDQAVQDQIANLEKDLTAAQALVEKLSAPTPEPKESAPAANAPSAADLKKAKVSAAMAGVKLKKLQKQLTETPDDQGLKEQIGKLENELKDAQELVEKLSAPAVQTSTTQATAPLAANVGDLKKLKIDAAMAKATVKKVEKALKKAEEIKAPEIDILRQQLVEAQKRADDLEKALANPAEVKAEVAAPAAPSNANEDKKRKIDLAIAKASIKKAEKNIELLKEQGKSEEEINSSEWPKKLEEAQQKLDALTSDEMPESVQTATQSETKEQDKSPSDLSALSLEELADKIKKQKIAAAMAKAQINKLNKQLANEPESASSIQQDIDAARQKQADAEALLTQLTDAQAKAKESQ
ncbi:electron transport complex subunit RsxC [Marinomonas sp. C2222]|uniref:Ion-translocating oxidoreductase complex subunit C n=1 Tax=Marinomonas sargassi TaxID=2984494 RepID=A0ABT2YTN4_9GAMM|nr:electron transport complex subunit RsxC [Marinomonas sargassi]MCV2403226.1 electron transport complex subunit RsxC [Marinomonas sargassi]